MRTGESLPVVVASSSLSEAFFPLASAPLLLLCSLPADEEAGDGLRLLLLLLLPAFFFTTGLFLLSAASAAAGGARSWEGTLLQEQHGFRPLSKHTAVATMQISKLWKPGERLHVLAMQISKL
jgi:hypothetical protein